MNPVEKNYLKELLEYIGLDLRMDDKESEYSIICDAEGIAYARVRDGGYHINDSVPLEKEYQIQDAIQRAYGFRVQFERSESLDSLGVNGYRRIGGFGDAVLAAKLMQDNRFIFPACVQDFFTFFHLFISGKFSHIQQLITKGQDMFSLQ